MPPRGTAYFRVNSATVLPGTNISELETVVTLFSEASVAVKIDGPDRRSRRSCSRVTRSKASSGPGPGQGDRQAGRQAAGRDRRRRLNLKSVPKTRKVTRKARR